jgi:APA family basic amino acid/polyamine antiporter
MAEKRVFVREATGLVRAWSPIDMLIYNWIAGMGLWSSTLVWVTNYGPFLYPGADLGLGLALCAVFLTPTFLVYAFLASSMPRTGGDYVWNSRIIHPAFAFSLTFTLVIWSLNWMYWDAYGVAVLAFSPVATLAGNVPLGVWLAGPSGIMVIGVFFTILTVFLTIRGMSFYAKFQRVAFVLSILAFVIFVGIMGLASRSDFIQSLNNFYAPITGEVDTYHAVLQTAASGGFTANTPFSLYATLGIIPMAIGSLLWGIQGTVNIGEVKKAESLKHVTFMTVGAGILGSLSWAVMGMAFVNAAGQDFLGSLSYQFWNGTPLSQSMGTMPFFTFFGALVSRNPLLTAILFLGAGVSLYMYYPGMFILCSRWLFGMSFDRLLPERITKVDSRFNTPYVAIVIIAIASIAWTYLYAFTELGSYTAAIALVSVIMVMVVCVSGILFPYVSKVRNIYSTSPAGKYKVVGIPLVVVAGILGLFTNFVLIYYLAVIPEFGAWTPGSLEAIGGTFIFGIVLFLAVRAYRVRQGLAIDLAFREIPPE